MARPAYLAKYRDGAKKMVAKGKTYGKKKARELVAIFSDLSITPSKGTKEVLAPAPKSHNELLSEVNTAPEGEQVAADANPDEDKENGSKKVTTQILAPTPKSHNGPLSDLPNTVLKREQVTADSNPDDNKENAPKKETRRGKQAQELKPHHQLPPEITTLTTLPFVSHSVVPFQKFCTGWSRSVQLTKIGQGSFATVLKMELKTSSDQYSVWKMMPLKPLTGSGCRPLHHQTLISDALTELRMLYAMSTISGFVQYRSAHVVCGSVPAQISLAHETWAGSLDARDAWYGTRMEVEYPSPTQLWLMMEMTDAGRDLDSMLCDARKEQTTFPMHEVFDIFWGIAEAMMRGEGLAEFEHRDLHAGNICLKRRDSAVDVSAEEGVARKSIYEVTLIDYTQSRLRLETGEVLATAIDESIFRQMDDDADAQRQYDVYRCMRDVVKRERKAGVTVGQMWREYVPVTNVLWLQHTLEELLAVTRASETKEELDMILALAKLKSKLSEGRESKRWRYRSAREVVCGFLVDQQAG